MAQRIEDYALIGDCETAALVGRDGSIDWLCWPRFDSGAVFAALLGEAENGRWVVAAAQPNASIVRLYRRNTLILETEIKTDTGSVVVIDFMPLRREGTSHIVRLVRGRAGQIEMCSELVMRFDYGSIIPWVTRHGDHSLHAVAGPDSVILHSQAVLKPDKFRHRASFVVHAGETVCFTMGYSPSYNIPPNAIDPLRALEETEKGWKQWSGQCTESGPYSEAVVRSLITLKALTYRPTGGIVASPTTSLPETLGGRRNWDYRFCWLRDATFTLLALMNAGFTREAADWRLWLRRAVAGNPAQVQIMYGLAGERRLDEWEVPWLAGYEGAKPVRIGNGAAKQLQLDIYGEVMDALYQGDARGLATPEHTAWPLECKLIEHLETCLLYTSDAADE